MGEAVSREDMERANRLVCWMAGYIGNMAPGGYGDCFAELNDHFLAMQRIGIPTDDPSKSTGAG